MLQSEHKQIMHGLTVTHAAWDLDHSKIIIMIIIT